MGDTANEVNNIYTLSFFTQVLGVGGQEIQNVETQLMDTAFNGQRNGNWIGMNEKNPSNSINAVGIAGLDSLNRDNCANDTLGQIVIKEDISKLLPADVLLHGIVGTDSSGQIINLGPINIQIFPFGPRISTPDQVKLYLNPAQQLSLIHI